MCAHIIFKKVRLLSDSIEVIVYTLLRVWQKLHIQIKDIVNDVRLILQKNLQVLIIHVYMENVQIASKLELSKTTI